MLCGSFLSNHAHFPILIAYFGKTLSNAREKYLAYTNEGILKWRKPELVGGGLIRSLGGWAEVKANRLKHYVRT